MICTTIDIIIPIATNKKVFATLSRNCINIITPIDLINTSTID
nr:hypothetical protein [cyanobacterium endosymbiont of Rhopalodia gibberula]